MIRTQVYVTEEQDAALRALSAATGQTRGRLVRGAIQDLLARETGGARVALLRRARGLWAGRRGVPDIDSLRGEFRRAADQAP